MRRHTHIDFQFFSQKSSGIPVIYYLLTSCHPSTKLLKAKLRKVKSNAENEFSHLVSSETNISGKHLAKLALLNGDCSAVSFKGTRKKAPIKAEKQRHRNKKQNTRTIILGGGDELFCILGWFFACFDFFPKIKFR